jgi:addiction module HigA family antidote
MIPKNRAPTSPGEILLEEFLTPMGITQTALAEKMSVPLQRVNTLINGKRAVSADTALLLSEIFGTSPEFWMNLQTARDLYDARRRREATRVRRPPSRVRRSPRSRLREPHARRRDG